MTQPSGADRPVPTVAAVRKVRKAVIPAAGHGTRFLPATKAQPKEMLPIVDKPAIQYVVEEAVRAGLDDILIVTGRGKRTLEDHFDRSFELERYLEAAGKFKLLKEVQAIAELADVHYIRQRDPRGLGHAISVARRHVGDEAFAVLLPDDIMTESAGVLTGMLGVHERFGCSVASLMHVPLEVISAYGSARVEPVEEGIMRVFDLVEKPMPEEAPSPYAVLGRYVFTPDIFEALDRVPPGKGGEIQITDAMALLAREQPMLGYVFDHGRYDAGDKLDYLRATIELALEREDLGPPLRAFLVDLVRRNNLA
jgi:UTP--glucose-1-phosphate uridylyltransferase